MLVSRLIKGLIIALLFGFSSMVADIHVDDLAASHHKGEKDSCCVTCCPAHNLGPSVHFSTATPIQKIDCEFSTEIVVYSEEVVAFVFHPPRPSV